MDCGKNKGKIFGGFSTSSREIRVISMGFTPATVYSVDTIT